jgi:hypothetical protein
VTSQEYFKAQGREGKESLLGVMHLYQVNPFDEADIPKYRQIRYWRETDYTAIPKDDVTSPDNTTSHGKHKHDANTNNMGQFVEDLNGKLVCGDDFGKLRDKCREIFCDLHEVGLAAKTWKRIGLMGKNYFIYHMESAFPCLRLCINHWKALRIGQDIYSQWYTYWILEDGMNTNPATAVPPKKKAKKNTNVAVSSTAASSAPPPSLPPALQPLDASAGGVQQSSNGIAPSQTPIPHTSSRQPPPVTSTSTPPQNAMESDAVQSVPAAGVVVQRLAEGERVGSPASVSKLMFRST